MEKLQGKLTVLVIDDDRHARLLVKTMLSAFPNIKLLEAGDAETAWATFSERTIDLILVDCHMPKINGLQVVRRIRQSELSPNPAIPIIVLTGHTSPTIIGRARDAGADAMVAKPISAEALFRQMDLVLSRQRRFVTTRDFTGPDRRRRQQPFPLPNRRKA